MKITIINTTEQKGGASIACKRLMVALNKNGINIKMLVCDKSTNDKNVILINTHVEFSLLTVFLNLIFSIFLLQILGKI